MREPWLEQRLVCPVCKGALAFAGISIRCPTCRIEYPQETDDWTNLLPPHVIAGDRSAWPERQRECDAWYTELIASPGAAFACLDHDYAPYKALLARMTGTVLDVGGGNGIVRHYLPPGTRYVTIDPSTAWLGREWIPMARHFPCMATRPAFVRGVGECLPFVARGFDAVMSLWSLNHVSAPEAVLREIARVLRPGGHVIITLEDMAPAWHDLAKPAFWRGARSSAPSILRAKLASALRHRAWPLQSDHIRIREADVRRWSMGALRIVRRGWVGPYLTYELER